MEEYAFQGACHADTRYMDRGSVAVEMPEQDGCRDGCHTIGGGNTHPHAIGTPNLREYEEERHEEHQLAAYRHEDAPLCHADTLKEVACHNLETHDGREDTDKAHASDC